MMKLSSGGAWSPAIGPEIAQQRVDGIRSALSEQVKADEVELEAVRKRAVEGFEPVKEHYADKLRADYRKFETYMGGGAAAIGIVAGALIGRATGGLTTALKGATIGGVASGVLGASGGALVAVVIARDHPSPRNGWRATSHGRAVMSPELKSAYADYWQNRYAMPSRDAERRAFDLELIEKHGSRYAEDAVARVAKTGPAFDHNRDGLIDVRPQSIELRRDAAGGPVGATTEEVVKLPEHLRLADADNSRFVDPREAIRAQILDEMTPAWETVPARAPGD